jgi:hypothetical protein
MSEPTRKTFAEHLVAQDPPVSEEKYREHRMQLEKALTDSSRRESRVRMTVLVLWLLCWIDMVTFGPAIGGHAFANGGPPANGWALRLLSWHFFLLIVTVVETVSYFVRFLPARLRAGSALNRNILLDLDRRITDLAGRIDRREDRPEQTQG